MPKQSVTKEECKSISGPIIKDLEIIKNALIGADLQGGLVRRVSDLKDDLKEGQLNNKALINQVVLDIAEMKKEVNGKKEASLRLKLVAYGATSSIIVSIIIMGAEILAGK
jgi:hypothetical protein